MAGLEVMTDNLLMSNKKTAEYVSVTYPSGILYEMNYNRLSYMNMENLARLGH